MEFIVWNCQQLYPSEWITIIMTTLCGKPAKQTKNESQKNGGFFSKMSLPLIDGMENYFSTYDSLMVINDVKETKASPTANGNKLFFLVVPAVLIVLACLSP